MKKFKLKVGFTLAEVLITLTILGVVAAITVPSLMHKNQDRINKVRIRKAMANYEKLMNQVMIENDLRSNEMIDKFASNNNCINTRKYFKSTKDGDTNCKFKTSDGLWWDITDLRTTIVSFKEENLTKSNAENSIKTNAFKMISGYENGLFFVNALSYMGSKFDKVATKKLIEYAIGKVTDSDMERYMSTPCQGQVYLNGLQHSFSPEKFPNRKGCYVMTYSNEVKKYYYIIYDDDGIYKEGYFRCLDTNYSSCEYRSLITKLNDGNYIRTTWDINDGTITTTDIYNQLYDTDHIILKQNCDTDGTNCQTCYNTTKKTYELCQN